MSHDHFNVISSTGANAAYLCGDQSCVSINHSFCALLILTNGAETFVSHLSGIPDDRKAFKNTLKRIKKHLGKDTTAILYKNDFTSDVFKEIDTDKGQIYAHILEDIVGKQNLEQRRTSQFDAYWINAQGSVKPIETEKCYKALEHEYGLEEMGFQAFHNSQIIMAWQYIDNSNVPLFRYSNPPRLNCVKKIHLNPDYHQNVEKRNAEPAKKTMCAISILEDRPVLVEDALTIHNSAEHEDYLTTYKNYKANQPATTVIIEESKHSAPSVSGKRGNSLGST